MVKRKTAVWLTAFGFILLWILITQDIDAALKFGKFPNGDKLFVEKISRKYGLGHCPRRIPDSLDPSDETIRACFMSAGLSGEKVIQSIDPKKDISYLFYTCHAGGIYGEVTYVFFRSSSEYWCTARIAEESEKVGQLDVNVMAVTPPDPTFVVWLTAKLYSLWGAGS